MLLVNNFSLLALSVSTVISTVTGTLFTSPSQLPVEPNYDFIIVGGEWGFFFPTKVKLIIS